MLRAQDRAQSTILLLMKIERETTRRLVHFGAGGIALVLVTLGRGWSLALAGTAVLYNLVIAPRFGFDRGYRRDGEGRWGGLATYAIAVLLLLLVAPLTVAAGAWAVLAVADPVAATVGQRFPRPKVPWNPRKSLVGTAFGSIAGGAACYLALWSNGAEPSWLAAACAGLAGGLAETIPWRDDNLLVAAGAAAALWPMVT